MSKGDDSTNFPRNSASFRISPSVPSGEGSPAESSLSSIILPHLAPALFRAATGNLVPRGFAGDLSIDQILLADAENVIDEPVYHQTAGQVLEEPGEHQRHDHHDPALGRVRDRAAGHRLLNKHGG